MGLVAPRLAFTPLVAVLALAFGATTAHAVNYNFAVAPSSPNQGEVTTFKLTPNSGDVDSVFWDLDGDGSYDDGTARTVTSTYASPGPVTVRMAARETSGSDYQIVIKTIVVNGTPAADFGFTPAEPAGRRVRGVHAGRDGPGGRLGHALVELRRREEVEHECPVPQLRRRRHL